MNPSNEAGQGGSGAVPVNPDGQNLPAQAPAQPPAMRQPVPPAMTLPLPPNPAAPAAQNVPQTDVSATTQVATPPVIDDGDLIEKEWVHKAKQIVDQNRNDPYKQSEELTMFKADYMKKRYNKNIKVDE